MTPRADSSRLPAVHNSRSAARSYPMGTREHLLGDLQRHFEVSSDQFPEDALASQEWNAADDALERLHTACALRKPVPLVRDLCRQTRGLIDFAVEISALRSAL